MGLCEVRCDLIVTLIWSAAETGTVTALATCVCVCLCVRMCLGPWVMSKYSNHAASSLGFIFGWPSGYEFVCVCTCDEAVNQWSPFSLFVLAVMVCVLTGCNVCDCCALVIFYSWWVNHTVQELILPLRNSRCKDTHAFQLAQSYMHAVQPSKWLFHLHLVH